jgi:large subunit ribosomal protein L37Ae
MGNRTKKVGPTRGLGPRYGSTVRKRYIKIMQEMKKPHKCPQCGFTRVKRESVGIWKCGKCGHTYTGGAYTPITKLGIVAKRSAKGVPVEETLKTTEEQGAQGA